MFFRAKPGIPYFLLFCRESAFVKNNKLVEDKYRVDSDYANLQKTVEKKNEIEQLMLEFDTNKANKEQRQAIKIKLDKAMEEYNKLILPVALSQINNNQ